MPGKMYPQCQEYFIKPETPYHAQYFSRKYNMPAGYYILEEGREFSYDFWYDDQKQWISLWKFVEISKDQYGNEKENIWLLKDVVSGNYQCDDEDLLKNDFSCISK